PVYLYDAEVQFGLHARAIASTARDTNGRFLPVYFQMPAVGPNVWFHPFIVYWTVPWLWILPFGEYAVRLPSAVLGILNILLAYAIVLKLTDDRVLALSGAVFAASMPVHFIFSRVAMDYLHPVLFIQAWVWCLADFLKIHRERSLMIGSVILG